MELFEDGLVDNLLHHPWIAVRRRSGRCQHISPVELTSLPDDPIIDFVAVRPDFHGALYQLLIGLLQSSAAPADESEWLQYWLNPPSAEQLQQTFAPYTQAFDWQASGPAFMQDLQLPADANQCSVRDLLIDAGSDSNLYFNKPSASFALCPSCSVQALLTLQINAPPGGRGTRTSVRGGGPLTTLLLPADSMATLWQKLWLNVIPQPVAIPEPALVWPWLAQTRSSDAQGVGDTTPELAHPLQAYWCMPRRIRFDYSTCIEGECTLCGAQHTLMQHYHTRYGGVNYTGAWEHPLTPYNHDSKKNLSLPLKGKYANGAYRHWLGLALGSASADGKSTIEVAKVLKAFNRKYNPKIRRMATRLWCFGYDMDNMKALCWYESILPVYALEPEQQPKFRLAVQNILILAQNSASALQKYVKAACFRKPTDVKSDPAIAQSFWQGSETQFYHSLSALSQIDLSDAEQQQPIIREWGNYTRNLTLSLFDQWVLSAAIEDMNLQRVVQARSDLLKALNKSNKSLAPTM